MYIRSQWIHNLLDFGLQVGWLVFQVFFLWFQFTRWPTAFHWRSRHHWYASSSNIESQLQQSQNQGFARTCRTTLLNATAVARLCIFGTSALAAEPTSPSVYHFQRHITEGAHFECFGELNCEDYAAGRVRWGLGDLDRWHRTLMEYYILVQPIIDCPQRLGWGWLDLWQGVRFLGGILLSIVAQWPQNGGSFWNSSVCRLIDEGSCG